MAQRIVRLQSSSPGCHLLGGVVEREILKLHEDLSTFLRRQNAVPASMSAGSASSSSPPQPSSSSSKQSKVARKHQSGNETSWIAHLAVRTPGVGITVNENADPTVRRDMNQVLELLTGESSAVAPRTRNTSFYTHELTVLFLLFFVVGA